MDRPGHESVSFFICTEVEHSPAFGQLTLFVVGVQDSTKIIKQARLNNCTHIYFGANQSFPRLDVNDGNAWQPWDPWSQNKTKQSKSDTLRTKVK